ncbi:hypothetical protein CSV79_01580 [Sporosarcina sp. P13]|uniref:hypothetical protein n=1 Tax=Sporosarcina sp. P13 TaxID=2048263 RepID=UPI000C16E690|nr:hypothetical protein [Sporosarcina sp. P13]PIC65339.1 hypothetical protein CSV79_01580 [Sporosarcina sp. P13]
MPYLTNAEYSSLPFEPVESTEFDRLERRASDVLDSLTSNFYQFNDLANDIPFRRDKFKKAVACQIEYFQDMGATTSHSLNEPGSVTIGRTSMSSGASGSATSREPGIKLISVDVYMYLHGTGLLYRGIGVR